MYVNTRGMRRRGMGDLQDLAPNDPVLQNIYEGNIPGGTSGGSYPLNPVTGAAGATSLTTWLNQNTGTVALVGGGFFALMLLGKGLR
jgi:hypothetical protein